MLRFRQEELAGFGARVLEAAGVPRQDAMLTARLLVKADLCGYAGHGIGHIVTYISRIRSGLLQLEVRPQKVREGKTTALIDGRHYMGQVVAYEAMQLAIRKAKEHGVGVVCIFHSGHIGRLADYVELAAAEAMIGVASVSVGAGTIPPYGGIEPVAGTNPVAYGIPVRSGRHILLDFATAASSMGELRTRAERGEAIPPGVMLDHAGNPTTDFKAFVGPPRGVVLPFGGYKGSGLHLVTEILGGLLTGNGLGKQWWHRWGPAVNGVFLEAISIEEFQPLDTFFAAMDELVALAKSRKRAPGVSEIYLPGDRARKRAEENLKAGIPIEAETWDELLQVASEHGVKDAPRPLP